MDCRCNDRHEINDMGAHLLADTTSCSNAVVGFTSALFCLVARTGYNKAIDREFCRRGAEITLVKKLEDIARTRVHTRRTRVAIARDIRARNQRGGIPERGNVPGTDVHAIIASARRVFFARCEASNR